MSENQNNKKVENRGENLVDITDDYNKNERPQDESESILDEAVDKVKAGTKAVVNKVKDTDKDLGEEYNKEKTL
ncbi:hypothetical protein NMY3_01655 [Candidatus Nitrosocosmicus oleophilus]|jgi:hypothetical protein|uniref:Uncharacterized protein n=1 Tax=Candidatus Nitrosocosmicus oleophilus TaxID=1353260 RepID=A0A654LWN4_9ARCH|nr:hypothetical protein [Candidatus Nitrosocosmicus oleophilus]ALI35858.1 hypothetical protein NMY3_01655 [Candidatus Nitrosocosmicus oleophilus]